jgi:hypothetical protein
VVNAMGYSGLYFKWSVCKSIIMFAFIWLGHYWGIIGLLVTLVFYNIVLFIINAVLVSRFTHYTLGQQVKDLLPVLLSSGLVAVAVWYIRYLIPNNFALILVQSVVFAGLYLGVHYMIDKSILSEALLFLRRKNN